MGEVTEIAWTDHTFNPWWGCQRVSPGCEHCYAETFAKRTGHAVWGPQTDRRFFGDKHWAEPLKWDAAAAKAGVRRRVFCASMADVFEDRAELVAPRARLWRLIGETPHLDWLLLTKRPQNADQLARTAALHAWDGGGADAPVWLANIWLGTTVEDQKRADERIPLLLNVPAQLRFLSCEPLLQFIRIDDLWDGESVLKPLVGLRWRAVTGKGMVASRVPKIDWVIVGGESGGGARPFDLAWARAIVGHCKVNGVACFVKQYGARAVDSDGIAGSDVNGLVQLRDRKGGDWTEWTPDLRVREWPTGASS